MYWYLYSNWIVWLNHQHNYDICRMIMQVDQGSLYSKRAFKYYISTMKKIITCEVHLVIDKYITLQVLYVLDMVINTLSMITMCLSCVIIHILIMITR